jgi:hypothetical protein
MAKRRRDSILSFPDMVGFGENPSGMVAQTPNETARDTSGPGEQQPKWRMEASGSKWNTWPYEDQVKPQIYTPRNRRR